MNDKDLIIERFGKSRDAVITSPAAVISFQVEDVGFDPRTDGRGSSIQKPFEWTNSQMMFGDLEILPYGDHNNMPQLLRDVVYNNPNIPGVFEKKQGLLWGQGPGLYKENFVKTSDGKTIRTREWQENKKIQDWLDSWDYIDYLLDAITDFNFIQGSFTRFVRTNGTKIGQKAFHSLENMGAHYMRLAREFGQRKATHAIHSDYWFSYNPVDYKVYPLFDAADPFGESNQVMYSRTRTFATDHYSIPTIFGALEWIRRSTAIPLILKALSKNSMAAKYHVTSPAKFWDKVEEQLIAKAQEENRDYSEADMKAYEKKLFKTIVDTLSDEGNTGKIWHTKNFISQDGVSLIEQGWTIKPIDQNIKDFVETQIKIADKADSAVSAAVGIHKALGGITDSGKSDSGSEQLYAYLMFKLIGVDIPEYVVCKALNAAIRAMFLDEGLKIGFYHEEAQRMQDQTSKDRVKNSA